MKRIIDGKTYNIDTATKLAGGGDENSLAWWGLFRTRHDAFFRVTVDHDGESNRWEPLTDEVALNLLQIHAPQLVEECFGRFPEAGASERRLTIRVPGNLAARVEAAAEAKGISLNSYAMRCFERCAGDDGQPRVRL